MPIPDDYCIRATVTPVMNHPPKLDRPPYEFERQRLKRDRDADSTYCAELAGALLFSVESVQIEFPIMRVSPFEPVWEYDTSSK